MFRQVVMYRWGPSVTEQDKDACRRSLAGLTEIPELLALNFGDDARHFEGNFDFVATMDFADFAAARRYVVDPRHQEFVHSHATPCVAERAVVQHDWARGGIAGLHQVNLPVTDVERSRDWYMQALDLVVEGEFHDDHKQLADVSLRHPTVPLRIGLRQDPPRAAALAGFDVLAMHLPTPEDLQSLLDHLDRHHIAYTGPVVVRPGIVVADVPDPDGLVIRLHSDGDVRSS